MSTQSRQLSILALVHRVPFPPNKGEKIRAYQELKFLAEQGHHIDLLTFADVKEDRSYGPELSKICRRVRIIPKNKKLGRLRSGWTLPVGRPLSVGYFHSFRMSRVLSRWLDETHYDVAFCYSSPMAEYVRHLALPKVMDFVDVDSDKWRQYAEHTKQPMKSVYKLEAHLLSDYERAIAESFEASVLVSEAEVGAFRKVAPGAKQIVSVPNGVDTAFFGQTVRTPEPAERPLLVFVGQMDYFANVDAVIWFANSVFPRIRAKRPSARFRIVGRAPTAEVKALADLPGVEVTGGVADVRDHLAVATIAVAPLRIARGIQNKVLEAMAACVPVVASPNAFEGIDGVAGEDALVAESEAPMAQAVERVLSEPGLGVALAKKARTLVEQRYAWAPAMARLEALLLAAAESRPPAR